MAWCARHDIMVWPGGHGMIHAITWLASHGIWHGLADIAWYLV